MFFDINPKDINYINYYFEDENGDYNLLRNEREIDLANACDVYLKDGRVCELNGSFFVSDIRQKFLAYQYEEYMKKVTI